jgi:hypothetical protein
MQTGTVKTPDFAEATIGCLTLSRRPKLQHEFYCAGGHIPVQMVYRNGPLM